MKTDIKEIPDKMRIYKKPIYYAIIHILFGVFSFYYIWGAVFFIFYQLLQLFLNKRFFLFQLRIEEGNSLAHTSVKFLEFLIGLMIGATLHKYVHLKLPFEKPLF